MNKRYIFIIMLIVLVFVCVISIPKIFVELQRPNVKGLGWEADRYLWTIGMFGNTRWDVEQSIIVNSTYQPDLIEHIFISQEGDVWGYGYGVWQFKSGNWIDVSEAGSLKRGVISDLTQTNDGAIWIATWQGFKTWNRESQHWESSLINKSGRVLIQDANNTLWFGLREEGVIQVQSDNMTHWTTANGLVNNRIRSMLSTREGTLWVGTDSGLSYWDGDSWQSWIDLGEPDADGLTIYKLLEASDGAIWADTSQDFAMWKQEQWTTYYNTPFCGEAYSFLEVNDSSLWAGCAGGLFRWTGSDWQEYGTDKGIYINSFAHLIQGNNGILYAGTTSGLYEYLPNEDRWKSFP